MIINLQNEIICCVLFAYLNQNGFRICGVYCEYDLELSHGKEHKMLERDVLVIRMYI